MVMLCAPVWTMRLYGPFEYTIQRTNVAKLVQIHSLILMTCTLRMAIQSNLKCAQWLPLAFSLNALRTIQWTMNIHFLCVLRIELNDWRMHFKLTDILMGWSFGRLSGDYMKFAPILETPLMCPRYCASVKSETAFSNADCPDGTIGVMHRHHNRVV